MPLQPGARVGGYEVLGQIGVGGMGEVYRARDARLKRDVALKVLPESVAQDADRLARFQREAELLATLNHPQIAAIYGLEESDGVRALVLELVEGPTLADRISRGPLPLDEALSIARQIADALDAAHSQGIIHRDLKPANIKVRDDGTVKVLDFGLAKALEPGAGARPDLTNSPTITSPAMMTGAGMILGTAAYMSPEQAKGRTADKRSDVWAFGVVLHEMLTGTRLFHGETITETLAAVIEREPSWDRIPARVLPPLRRCLEKDPKRRLRDAGDAMAWIDQAPAGEPSPAVNRSGSRAAWIVAVACGLAFVAALAALLLSPRFSRTPAEAPTVRFAVSTQTAAIWMALSPDGRSLAYVDGAGRELYLRSLDSLESRPLAGTEGAGSPFWAPDNQSIGFVAGGALKSVSVRGGPPHTVISGPGVNQLGGSWSDGAMLFVQNGSLYQVGASGGVATPVLQRTVSGGSLRYPQFLAHSRRFIYLGYAIGNGVQNAIYVASLDTLRPTKVLNADYSAQFVDPGYLLVVKNGDLVAQPVKADTIAPIGEPTVVAQQIQVSSNINVRSAMFSASASGSLAYRASSREKTRLVWLDRRGMPIGTSPPADADIWVAEVSPDGSKVALETLEDDGTGDIWVMDVERGTKQALTRSPQVWEFGPHWSPDSRSIAYASSGLSRTASIRRRSADGSGPEETLAEASVALKMVSHWSADGKFILFSTSTEGISMLLLAGKRVTLVPQTGVTETQPRLSPDGRWLAYSSNESGRAEVYVRPFTGGPKVVVSTEGGVWPYWRPDGHELYYVAPDNTLQAVSVMLGASLIVGKSLPLFQLSPPATGRSPYSTSDGEHFLVRTSTDTSSTIAWVLNWPALLRRP
jgi:eukaryotic-like serine/threonine-protein kinase